MLDVVDNAVSSRFGTDEAASPVGSLSGEDTNELVPDFLVSAKHEADLATASSDIASCGGVRGD